MSTTAVWLPGLSPWWPLVPTLASPLDCGCCQTRSPVQSAGDLVTQKGLRKGWPGGPLLRGHHVHRDSATEPCTPPAPWAVGLARGHPYLSSVHSYTCSLLSAGWAWKPPSVSWEWAQKHVDPSQEDSGHPRARAPQKLGSLGGNCPVGSQQPVFCSWP